MQIKLSIIMPVHKAENRLELAIDSVLSQTFKDFELILIDDGSPDRSGEICDDYSKRDDRVIVIHQENAGVSEARNRGIREARGEYIAFIDSDDIITPDTYKNAVTNIENNSADAIIFGMVFDYYRGDKYCYSINKAVEYDLYIDKNNMKNYFFYLYDKNYLHSVCNKVFKRSLIIDNNIFFENRMSILEDFKFTLDVLTKTNNIIVLKNIFYRYYKNLSIYSFYGRSNIDYISSFRILDGRLRKTAEEFGLVTTIDQKKISSMILRYYLISIEKLFCNSEAIKVKYDKLIKFNTTPEILKVINEASYSRRRFRLMTIHFLLKKKLIVILFGAFYLNNIFQNVKRKLMSFSK